MINNRQNGRRRGRGGGNGGGGPRQGGQQGGRGDNGNRIDSRARGNASQLLEKYKSLAADAQRQGDRVNTEYYLQFADHYFRVLADQRGRFEEQQPRRQSNDFDMDGDDDYGDEGEPIRGNEQQGDDGDRQPPQRRADPGEFRRQEMGEFRRQESGEARRDDQGESRRWDSRRNGRDEGNGRDEDRAEIGGQHRSDPPPTTGERLSARAQDVLEADAPTPRRRGRPRRDEGAVAANGTDAGGGAAAGVDADRLPPSLGISAASDGGDEAKPRRRRTPRPAAQDAPAAE